MRLAFNVVRDRNNKFLRTALRSSYLRKGGSPRGLLICELLALALMALNPLE